MAAEKSNVNYATMSKEQFLAEYAKHRPGRSPSAAAPKVGTRMMMSGRVPVPVEVVRVQPGAKSCCFVQDSSNGNLYYRSFAPEKGQLIPIANENEH